MGISSSELTDTDIDGITQGIASCSDEVDSDDLEITSISDSSSRRRRLLSSGVDIDYTTTLVLEYSSYSSSSDLFASAVSSFSSAVSNGDLESNIKTAANSSTLNGASVDSTTFSEPQAYNVTVVSVSDDGDDGGLFHVSCSTVCQRTTFVNIYPCF